MPPAVGYSLPVSDLTIIKITSQDTEILERVTHLTKKLFSLNIHLKKDKRTKRLYYIIISSKTLVEILNRMFFIPIGKKGKKLRAYHPYQVAEGDVLQIGPETFVYSRSMVISPGHDNPLWENSHLFPGAPEQRGGTSLDG